ncbi:MAG: 4-alpha-glucanotransferase [Planctomycetota bacterium]|nr:4-alpha-glucanotransferase [Planctomycetota bacterium]
MSSLNQARERLNIKRLVLQIHDPAFPAQDDEDTGRGSPYSNGAVEFLNFLQKLGFNGIQFGPQGQTARATPCPYDGQLFPHDFRSIALKPLVDDPYWRGILSKDTLERIVQGRPPGTHRTHHQYAWDELSSALDEAFACFRVRGETTKDVDSDFAAFCAANESWLAKNDDGSVDARTAFSQFVLDRQRRVLRNAFPDLSLYGDLQIGMSRDDANEFASLFHPDYLMGAPPSRTNPEGQPWGYAVFHPEQIELGHAQAFLRSRVQRMLSGFDGIRIDHPHGMVCPWVYSRDVTPPHVAVRSGSRLHESPNIAGHPGLADFAIARADQIDGSIDPFGEGWVKDLTDDQVRRYSVLMDVVLDCVREAGGDLTSDVACEVLSTLPYPLRRVMELHRLGRFRVVQKTQLDRPDDVYRIEQARPDDWIMMGNHDTPPIWLLARGWCDGRRGVDWGEYLAEQLAVPEARRAAFVRRVASDPGELVHALFAAILTSKAQHVSVFFTDLLGMTGFYNSPGVVNDTNWTLRVSPDFASRYERKCRDGLALDMARCVELAVETVSRQVSN